MFVNCNYEVMHDLPPYPPPIKQAASLALSPTNPGLASLPNTSTLRPTNPSLASPNQEPPSIVADRPGPEGKARALQRSNNQGSKV